MNFIFLSCTVSFPYEIAAVNTKVNSMAQSLLNQGHTVTIVGEPKGYSKISEVIRNTTEDGISYVVFPSKDLSSYYKNLKLIKKEIKRLFVKNENNVLFLCENGNLISSYILAQIAKKQGYHISTIYHEWRLAFVSKYPWYKRRSFVLSDKYFGKWSDSILPISHFLLDKAKRFSKPQFILPILFRYENDLLSVQNVELAKTFTYCASAGYFSSVRFVLDSFLQYRSEGGLYSLNLILSGTEVQLNSVKAYIKENGGDSFISIKTRLSDDDLKLNFYYSNALLIPLDPTNMQDVARFSQKISEYLASARPIITSNVGEIPFYFKDEKNALIADYDQSSYAKKLLFVEKNHEVTTQIGLNGFNTGLKYFNSDIICAKMVDFFNSICL